MSKRIFTTMEQEMLRANPVVRSCSARSIAFTNDFKKEAVRQYHEEGKTEQMIFTEARIPIALIGEDAPAECIRRWRSKTPEELMNDNRGKHDGNRGRPPKEKVDLAHMTISEQLEYYKTKSAFDDLKLAFFAQARGVPTPVFRYRPGRSTK
jgi:transposase-like protein